MRKYHNLDVTLNGALAAGNQDTDTLDIPAGERVVALLFTEIANANSKNYDLRIQDKTGIRMDFQHRLQLNTVIAGTTVVACAPRDREFPFDAEGGQKLKVDYNLIDALAGGQSITYRVTAITETC
jgi:hypothetical protein